ncbi:FAD binding domain-containing protein [Sneathiella limimaris]|uniref:FAD binding domain-containing protein n=1 Tax=Sneathiella limimaris TaxID=1964213 RepID=UPI00146D100A|nr:xanthine dehydrogenase family protein subunit M [Sneathiella limimaris]
MGDYIRPTELENALSVLSKGGWKVLAGGTDYYPAKVNLNLDDNILDLTALESLRGISKQNNGWLIGATTTWTDVVRTNLPTLFDGLKSAAREVGGIQIQNSGTVGGNICNASPAADGVAALIALDAEVKIIGPNSERKLPLKDFVLGNRKTALAANELLKGIWIPEIKSENLSSSFLKLGSRKYLVISLVMVSGVVGWTSDGTITDIRICLGACSPVATRLHKLEQSLLGNQLTSDLAQKVEDHHFNELHPIDDVRASAEYRIEAAQILVKRLLSGSLMIRKLFAAMPAPFFVAFAKAKVEPVIVMGILKAN